MLHNSEVQVTPAGTPAAVVATAPAAESEEAQEEVLSEAVSTSESDILALAEDSKIKATLQEKGARVAILPGDHVPDSCDFPVEGAQVADAKDLGTLQLDPNRLYTLAVCKPDKEKDEVRRTTLNSVKGGILKTVVRTEKKPDLTSSVVTLSDVGAKVMRTITVVKDDTGIIFQSKKIRKMSDADIDLATNITNGLAEGQKTEVTELVPGSFVVTHLTFHSKVAEPHIKDIYRTTKEADADEYHVIFSSKGNPIDTEYLVVGLDTDGKAAEVFDWQTSMTEPPEGLSDEHIIAFSSSSDLKGIGLVARNFDNDATREVAVGTAISEDLEADPSVKVFDRQNLSALPQTAKKDDGPPPESIEYKEKAKKEQVATRTETINERKEVIVTLKEDTAKLKGLKSELNTVNKDLRAVNKKIKKLARKKSPTDAEKAELESLRTQSSTLMATRDAKKLDRDKILTEVKKSQEKKKALSQEIKKQQAEIKKINREIKAQKKAERARIKAEKKAKKAAEKAKKAAEKAKKAAEKSQKNAEKQASAD